jgi:hypothetical protein
MAFFARQNKSIESVLAECKALTEPAPPTAIRQAATFANGYLKSLSADEYKQYLEAYRTQWNTKTLVQFVPAAGAASRQFQLLKTVCHHEALASATCLQEVLDLANQRIQSLSQSELSPADSAEKKQLTEVLQRLPRFWEEGICQRKFAFVDALADVLSQQGLSLSEAIEAEDIKTVGRAILEQDNGLGYQFLPKALLLFHSYPQEDGSLLCRTALEEHIRAMVPLFAGQARVRLHLAISEEHEAPLQAILDEMLHAPDFVSWLSQHGRTHEDLDITWSMQAPHTDAVALDPKSGQIARQTDGTPLLRKAGHGALTENIANLDADGIWIQNVDNILYDAGPIRRAVQITKQTMASLAFSVQAQLHEWLRQLHARREQQAPLDKTLRLDILAYLQQHCMLKPVDDKRFGQDSPTIIDDLITLMDRPLVIAGYVPLKPNQKGGGPFVLEVELNGIRVEKTNTVEGAEFEGGQNHPIFQSGICFNPVNLFLATQRFDGTRFNMNEWADQTRYFLSSKTDPQGRPIRAYERPGLWNGSIAKALQISIGTLANTFSAVKDSSGPESFLSPLHQPGSTQAVTPLDRERGIVDDEVAAFFEGHDTP